VGADYDRLVEPYRAMLVELADVARHLRERHDHLPDAGSEAAAELANEAKYQHDWSREPVMATFSWAGVLLATGEDHLRSIARLVVGEPSLYGPQSLARACIEAAGRSHWFTEPGIGVELRVARWQTERLHNFYQLKRLGQMSPAEAAAQSQVITRSATALGFNLLRGRSRPHTMVAENRPGGAEVFRRVLMDLPDEPQGLGHTMFGYLSASDHATVYALMQAMFSPEGVTRMPDGRVAGRLAVSSRLTNLLISVTIMGYAHAAQQRANLFGWEDADWQELAARAISLARAASASSETQQP
jgi:hypothetical protein